MRIKSWKTTFSGLAVILTVVTKIVNAQADWATDIPTLLAGDGLLTAKDHNATGS